MLEMILLEAELHNLVDNTDNENLHKFLNLINEWWRDVQYECNAGTITSVTIDGIKYVYDGDMNFIREEG